MRSKRPLAARLMRALLTLWALATFTFLLEAVLPADPARMLAGAQARPQDVALVRVQLGLDRPVRERYVRFWSRLLHWHGESRVQAADGTHTSASPAPRDHENCGALGPLHVDLGRSYIVQRPVTELLAERLPRTLWLGGTAFVLQMLLALGLGTLAASRPEGSPRELGLLGMGALFSAVPTFVLGIGLQYVFAYRLRWLPLEGAGGQDGFGQAAALVLPSLTLALASFAYGMRLVRDELRVELGRDHVRTARAKGAGWWRTLVVHGLRGALVPIATLAFLDLGALVSGAAVTESVFRWPGIGMLAVRGVLDRDGPVVMGTVLLGGVMVVVLNLVAEEVLERLDPRLR